MRVSAMKFRSLVLRTLLTVWLAGGLGLAWVPMRAAEAVTVKPAAVLTVVPDRADALYRRGEAVTFTVKLEVDGKAAADGEVQWT